MSSYDSSTSKISKSTRKTQIKDQDIVRMMDPSRFSVAKVNRSYGYIKGRRDLTLDPKEKEKMKESFNNTLGCKDIMMEIMLNFRDEELFRELMKYLSNFPDLANRESCLPILMKRRVWYCDNIYQLQFIQDWLNQETIVPDTELVMDFSSYNNIYTSTIEKFTTVHLKNMSISKRKLVDLINPNTSKIEHLKFTNFDLNFRDPIVGPVIFGITECLKKVTFCRKNQTSDNPLYALIRTIDLLNSNIEELAFTTTPNYCDELLINHLSHKLKRLLLANPKVRFNFPTLPNLEYFESEIFPSLNFNNMNSPTLCIQHPTQLDLSSATKSEHVKRLILRSRVANEKEFISFKNTLTTCEDIYPNCEELIIPETFMDALSSSDLKKNIILTSLKRIIFKLSGCLQPLKFGVLKYALLSLIPPNVEIIFETIQKEDYFETVPKTIKFDCDEETLFNRIENIEKHFKVMNNSVIDSTIRKIKRKFAKCIISKNNAKFKEIEKHLEILEGSKQNKQQTLQSLYPCIENYHDIFGDDQLYKSIVEKYDTCISILKSEHYNETEFSKNYNELEDLFQQMVKITKESGLSSKVLFNKQWFNDEIVEDYELPEDEIEFFEDSPEEMQKASLEIMLDEENNKTDIEMDEYSV